MKMNRSMSRPLVGSHKSAHMLIPEIYRQHWQQRWRFRVRQAALDGLYLKARLSGQLARTLTTPRVQFLYTHAIPDQYIDNVAKLLKQLARDHVFVDYGTAAAQVADATIQQPTLCFSLDDGLIVSERVLSLFDQSGIRACFFVVGGWVGVRDGVFDWAALERLRTGGHTIGAHSMTHPDMPKISLAQAQDEIGTCRDLLIRQFGVCDHFAWPYGRTTPELTALATQIGFRSIATGARGHYTARDRTVGAYNPLDYLYNLHRDAWFVEEPTRNIFTLMAAH